MTDTPCLDHLIRCNHETGQWFDPSFLPRCRAELSALKERVEAAAAEAYAVCREIADEEGRDCGCSKRIMDRIDAALQAARDTDSPKTNRRNSGTTEGK